jgi:hypothetical protein
MPYFQHSKKWTGWEDLNPRPQQCLGFTQDFKAYDKSG